MTLLRQFPTSYDESKEVFLKDYLKVKEYWPGARLVSKPIPAKEGLNMDWIAADPQGFCQKVVIITSGIRSRSSIRTRSSASRSMLPLTGW